VPLAGTSGELLAKPDPSARVGQTVRFVIAGTAPGRPSMKAGAATAVVNVTADTVRTNRPIARGARLASEDIEAVAVDLSGRPLVRLPTISEAAGARASRDLPAGTILGRSDILAEPLIRIGEIVHAVVHVGDVELIGSLVAADNGSAGDIIRVVNRESRRALHARIVQSGEVEVVDVR
jgi:flagella basal body P-ring formation protein FlgA